MRIEPKISSTLIDDIGASAAKCSLNFGPEITSDNDRSVVFPFALPRSPSQFEVPSFISFGLGVADVDGARYDVLLFAPIISVQDCVKSDQFAEPRRPKSKARSARPSPSMSQDITRRPIAKPNGREAQNICRAPTPHWVWEHFWRRPMPYSLLRKSPLSKLCALFKS